MRLPRPRLQNLGIALQALLAVYVGCYYAILALPGSIRFRPRQMITIGSEQFLEAPSHYILDGERLPDFHGVPFALLAPMYQLDAKWIRPHYWHPYPRDAELDFDTLLELEKK